MHARVVITGMSKLHANSNVKADDEAIVVRAPRAADAIGAALSTAFAQSDDLPDDWRAMIARLDAVDQHHPRR